jgi:hypothetical protein
VLVSTTDVRDGAAMLSRSILIVLSATCCLILAILEIRSDQTESASTKPYQATASAQLRQAVTIRNWDDGGDISRFAYLHTSEVFTSAVVHRSGQVSELPVALNPRVGAYRVKLANGRDQSLDEYVDGDNGIDGSSWFTMAASCTRHIHE